MLEFHAQGGQGGFVRHCRDCQEELRGPENFGTDLEPLCMLCSAMARVERAQAAGLTAEQLAALSQVLVRATRARYTALAQGHGEGEDGPC